MHVERHCCIPSPYQWWAETELLEEGLRRHRKLLQSASKRDMLSVKAGGASLLYRHVRVGGGWCGKLHTL